MSASVSGKQFETHGELMDLLPRKPRLISELLLVPNGPKSLTFYGAQQPRTVQCEHGVAAFAKVLSYLDGSHTLEDLAELPGVELAGGVKGFVSLLQRYGLLEEGDCDPYVSTADASAVQYFARFQGVSLHHRSRTDVMAHAHTVQLLVACPTPLKQTLSAAFDGVGLHSVAFAATADEVRQLGLTHGLVVLDGGVDDEAVLACADAMHGAGTPYFVGDIGADRVQVGPHVLPGITASHRCLAAQLPRPRAACDALDREYQCAFIAHTFLQVVLKLSVELFFNKSVIHSTAGQGEFPAVVKLARMPGSAFGGLAHTRALPLDHPAFAAWVHHSGIRQPPRQYLSPRVFQTHFTVANMNLHDAAVSTGYSPNAVPLPVPVQLPDALPWLQPAARPSHGVMPLAELTAILRMAAGEQTLEEGQRRRIAPTAGQLRSPGFYVIANQVQGLAQGVYQYDGERDVLIPVATASVERLRKALPALETTVSQVTLIATAHLARVRSKYDDFAYNLVHLDAGVACHYATLAAQALGWPVVQDNAFDRDRLAQCLMLTTADEQQIICACLHVGPSSPALDKLLNLASGTASNMARCSAASLGVPSTPRRAEVPHESWRHTLAQYSEGSCTEHTLLARRASYAFATSAVETALLCSLVAFAHHTLWTLQQQKGSTLALRPWLLLPCSAGPLKAGIYECAGATPEQWVSRTGDLPRSVLVECLNQSHFSEAGAVLVLMADLEQTFVEYGKAGYEMLLLESGSTVASLWLAATAAGLVGTPAGGVIDAGFMQHAGIDGYREVPMFALALANPVVEPSGMESAHGPL
jgi:SagB-type dehydrogenase family enzyme